MTQYGVSGAFFDGLIHSIWNFFWNWRSIWNHCWWAYSCKRHICLQRVDLGHGDLSGADFCGCWYCAWDGQRNAF